MEREIFVYIDLGGSPFLVGRLWTRVRGKKQSASFEYDQEWLSNPKKFSLDPALMLSPGSFHTGGDKPIFGAIGDSAPDRWGRALMRRAERRRARDVKETPRTLFEVDFLLGVNDFTRQGALRFSLEPGAPFLAIGEGAKIPPLVELPKLLSAAESIASESETVEELRLLIAPGSSLGGARPKASVLDSNGKLLIAKFPHKDDEIDVVRWEAVALTLAKRAGITVPKCRLEKIGRRHALLLSRFDRAGERSSKRIPFLSAMSMLEARDNESHSYLEIADALKMHGAKPKDDLKELFSRVVFNILVSNTDDHLRNHGFLYQDLDGWTLSPAYDLNPMPTDIKPRVLTTNITEDDGTASLGLAYEVASQFELDSKEAKRIVRKVGRAVAGWREVGEELGISMAGLKRMASAFEHNELEAATGGG
ncbi:MAG: HipA domain-containing protein [Bdellovibrionales bacterium]|nr:HipA domain-containing protein [Bdellovibrionales bacterium]